MIDTEKIISEFYSRGDKTYNILLSHGNDVANKAINVLDNMPNINVNRNFIVEASILHDIGICMTSSRSIGCTGVLPYLCHGVEGRKMLDNLGLYKHGLVCERHIGTGLSYKDIILMALPLPIRNMQPVSFEEKLICYADKFFSKERLSVEKDINTVLKEIEIHGEDKVKSFFNLHKYFNQQDIFYEDRV